MDVVMLLIGAALVGAGLLLGIRIGRSQRPGAASQSAAAEGAAAAGAAVAELLRPTSQALADVRAQLREVERERVGAYAGLREQVSALHRTSTELGAQARSLAGALRAPAVRGRWGELQLQRIVELAGMVEHCDFDTQVHLNTRDGPAIRPDLVVRLSGGRVIPVDAKVPFDAWLQASECPDDDRRRRLLAAHAKALRAHVDGLSARGYWEHFQPAPEFVVMFVPGEPLLDAAMTVDPSMAEHAFTRNVVIATPATLMVLLRTVGFTWRQERLSRSAEEIHLLGRELHGRLTAWSKQLATVGAGLNRAVDAYNASVRSMDARVLTTARRFVDLGVAESPVAGPATVDRRAWQPDGHRPAAYDITELVDDAEIAAARVNGAGSRAPGGPSSVGDGAPTEVARPPPRRGTLRD